MGGRFRTYRSIVALATIVLLFSASTAVAESNGKWTAQFRLGGRQPTLNESSQPWVVSLNYDFRLLHRVSDPVSIGLFASYSKVYNDSISNSTIKFGREFADRYWKTLSYGAVAKFHVNTTGRFRPFLEVGAGITSWEVSDLNSDQPSVVEDSDGNDTDFKTTELSLMAGLGAESFIHPRWSINYGIEFHLLTGLGADFADEVNERRSHGIFNVNVGVGFYFGPREKTLWERWREQERGLKERRTPSEFIERQPGGGGDSLRQTDQDYYADSDYDGVRDEIDLCPDTPAEARDYVDDTGCPTDMDADGVADYLDECYDTPPGMPVDEKGCSLDQDGDGVPDSSDVCPGTPRGYPVDRDGCFDKSILFTKRVLHINYPPGGSNLDSKSREYLDSLAVLMSDFPEVTATVYGYTDNIGEEDANLRLSQKRAEKVMGYLVLQGISKERIEAIGRGETNFIASNSTKFGREKNRRIEIEFSH